MLCKKRNQEIKIIEKVVHKNNEAYLARFLLVNSGGNIQWKIIDIVPIENQTEPEILLLDGKTCTECHIEKPIRIHETISPYFDLLFFVSQPTRAPNF